MKERNHVLIIGLAGFNAGDNLIAIRTLKELEKNHTITCVTFKKNYIAKNGYNEFFLDYKKITSWFKLFFKIIESDLIILGGGSLIQDKLGGSSTKGVLGYTNLTTLLAKLVNKKIISLPLGIDKLNYKKNHEVAKKILHRIKYLYVRDKRSKIFLKEAYNINAEYVPDPGIYDYSDFLDKDSYANSISISLVKENCLEPDSPIMKQLFEVVNYWLSKDYNINLIAMDSRGNDELSLYDLFPKNEKINIIDGDDLNKIIKTIVNSDFMLAMRLHAIIIGCAYTPTFCLSRTTKTHYFCENYNIEYLDIEKNQKIPIETIEKLKNLSFEVNSSTIKDYKFDINLGNSYFLKLNNSIGR